MKKLWLAVLIGLMCVIPGAADAQGIKAGDQTVSVFLGGAAPLQDSGVYSEDVLGDSVGNEELAWGDSSVSYGVQYMYAVSDYFAFGLEYMGNNFEESDYERSFFFDARNWGKEELESKMDLNSFMVAGRFTANPGNKIRFYVPFGLGLTSAKATLDIESKLMTGGSLLRDDASDSASSTSFSYYLGVGIEGDINENWLWGAEARYSGFTFDYDKFDNSNLGKKDLSYMSILLKLSYKF